MSGASVTRLNPRSRRPEVVTLTPEAAMQLLEHNTLNRPLSDQHVSRIARQIRAGKWRFNGDTIKVASDGQVLDGQHRCWAVVEAKMPVETIVVRGIEADAFATIDTLRKPRSGADVLALAGAARYRTVLASALTWLIRWQRGTMEDFKAPQNRVENSDIEAAFGENPNMIRAVERAMKLRGLANPSLVGVIYYVLSNRNAPLAERMIETLENPASVSIDDPFFRWRAYFTAEHHKRKEPLVTLALGIKAANAAASGRKLKSLAWRQQGRGAEPFPKLAVARG